MLGGFDSRQIRHTFHSQTGGCANGSRNKHGILSHYCLGGTQDILFGLKKDVLIASAGYSRFGVGAEVAGITVTKIIAKWFHGKEMALAMGIQVALARIGSQAAYAVAIPVANAYSLPTPLFIGLILLFGGMISFICFTFMDRKLDKQVKLDDNSAAEDKFSFKDVNAVF